MLTNDYFKLTDEQLARYNQWATERARDAFLADCGESHEVEIRFNFSPLGRSVVASCSGHTLTIEEWM